ncbi:hypothetical protein SLS53_000844 [Cytospora paraplurivora]|uniref:Uncharacterized protein n=1 Tax=Cytospora paraplurivora TaxID=2898453 RepID=A0AAN9YNI7_9PEZI
MENTYQLIASLVMVILAVAASWVAYDQGFLDPLIEKVGVYVLKAKGEAEAKELQAQGLKRGEDFFDSELKGNKQASEVKSGVGSLGGLKKNF